MKEKGCQNDNGFCTLPKQFRNCKFLILLPCARKCVNILGKKWEHERIKSSAAVLLSSLCAHFHQGSLTCQCARQQYEELCTNKCSYGKCFCAQHSQSLAGTVHLFNVTACVRRCSQQEQKSPFMKIERASMSCNCVSVVCSKNVGAHISDFCFRVLRLGDETGARRR